MAIKKYWDTGNKYYNSKILAFYKEAVKSKLFVEYKTPLHIFTEYENIFYNNRDEASAVMEQLKIAMQDEELSDLQQMFIISHLAEFFESTIYTDENKNEIDIDLILLALNSELMAKKETEFDFNKDLKTANNIEDLQERLLFLKRRLKEWKQYKAGTLVWDIEDKTMQYNEEIKYVQEQLTNNNPQQNKYHQPTPQQKETEPIKWNNDVKQLAYLFWRLKKENIIKNNTLGMTLSKLFIDKKANEIKNTILNKHFSDFDKSASYPATANEIDKFIASIKEHS